MKDILTKLNRQKDQLNKIAENFISAKQQAEVAYWQTQGRIVQLEEVIKMLEEKGE